ncbi:uncharacterized protein AKAW2_70087A [Aspergillus luchuensis]|nr:uncharacterized protein AKAW2_70087A [Aspergillus luchuensis]BCS03209.1 hypothetical protein AKAW2_70087A [Aspergillus luchuensis]
MAVKRPRRLARIPPENLSSNTSRAWPAGAKLSPRFLASAQPSPETKTKLPRSIASPSAETLPSSEALQPYSIHAQAGWGAYPVQACESLSTHTQIDHRKDGPILACFGYELAKVPRDGIHRPWFLPLKAA